jgi:hypothetical protein
MVVLAFLLVGGALGCFMARRRVALGASVAVCVAAIAAVVARSGLAYATDPDSVGVLVMTAFAPVGCGVALLLRGHRPGGAATRAG